MCLDDGALLIVATGHKCELAITDYVIRWDIETLFGCFKTRGFCLGSTYLNNGVVHLTDEFGS